MKASLLKAGLLGVVSLALIAAQEPSEPAPDYPEPPPLVAERIVDGRFEPGHFEYLRGHFPEASEVEKAQYAELITWLDACEQKGKARLDAELAELGIASIENGLLRAPSICLQVVMGDPFKGFANYAELAKATRGARLVFDTLVQSVKRAQERIPFASSDDFAGEIESRTMADQMLRGAYRWGVMEVSAPRTPKMTAEERTVFVALLGSEIMRVDRDNTEWLEAQVMKSGWPRQSQVGKRAAFGAWLITQHADLDPAFQRRALGLMEPLLATGEISKIGYASLYDRNARALNIKQRYGVQLICKGGAWEPHPLEEPERVDERREAMGLGPLAEHIAGNSQPCS
ncbi:MAG: hypothetical protein QNI87_11780 [Erythrobacter sp.]|uniref:DUF6624 domain-containing protein n=1 Tax=Erythrobacter sp. TaxID=1042 RepID=UPI00262D358E|nr:DUF6624 domain-containing protein [Erythrobacter sp.]MDJ0979197.1 hypothetical protein [Erythrobacter sp.]